MKILMVSIFAPHFFNWTEQLRDSGHEVYWLDVFDSNTHVEKIKFAEQISGWRYKQNFKGRYFLKEKAPKLNQLINLVNERKITDVLESKIREIGPDVVHSFVIYLSGVPILPVMEKFPGIKWILSTWGSDLYYYRNDELHLNGIKNVLKKVDYLFTDCQRDHHIAVENGFKGEFLGVFPGGGGYNLSGTDHMMMPLASRNIMLIKGYQGLHGKCIPVLKALSDLRDKLKEIEVVIYGANEEVKDFINNSEMETWRNLKILDKIGHSKVMGLMGQTLIAIGNSTSDGTPNTLLEALIMGAFPVQSNPGGATEEWIIDGRNGRLIHNPTDVDELREVISQVLEEKDKLSKGIEYNLQHLKPILDRGIVRKKVLEKYAYIEQHLNQPKQAK